MAQEPSSHGRTVASVGWLVGKCFRFVFAGCSLAGNRMSSPECFHFADFLCVPFFFHFYHSIITRVIFFSPPLGWLVGRQIKVESSSSDLGRGMAHKVMDRRLEKSRTHTQKSVGAWLPECVTDKARHISHTAKTWKKWYKDQNVCLTQRDRKEGEKERKTYTNW